MIPNSFDHFQDRVSPIHRADPRAKVVITLLFILATVLLPDGAWLAFALSWVAIFLVTKAAKLDYRLVFLRSLLILPFVFTAVTVLFSTEGTILLSWQIGSWTITISDAGVVRFASIVIRSWLSVQAAVLLTATTQFPDLMHALSHLRVPTVLVGIISFMYRYIFVLVDEALRLIRARQARSARLTNTGTHGGSVVWRARVTGNMVGQLFIRSLERSDRVYNGMLARGYQGYLLTMNPHVMRRMDWIFLATAVTAILLIQLIGRI